MAIRNIVLKQFFGLSKVAFPDDIASKQCVYFLCEKCLRKKPCSVIPSIKHFSTGSFENRTEDDDSTMKIPDRRPKSVLSADLRSSNYKSRKKIVIQDFASAADHKAKHGQDEMSGDKNTTITAWDVALEMRSARKESFGKQADADASSEVDRAMRALKRAEFHKQTATSDTALAKLLRKNIIYADSKYVIFNKPYGVASHGGDGTENHIKNALPVLSKMLHGVNTDVALHLCHRLENNVTGTMVCATDDDDTHRKLLSMFRTHRVLKKYWAIVVGRPDPQHGVVDIPLARVHIEKNHRSKAHTRMVASPNLRYDELLSTEVPLKRRRGDRALTYYQTLDSNGHVSLIELQPRTSMKHQVRVHLAEGLACPVLGDHKYSHPQALAPQRLPLYVLRKFGIQQSKARAMPMHLHLRQVLIPNVMLNQSRPHLMVGAKVPEHFARALAKFGLVPGLDKGAWHGKDRGERREAEPRDLDSELYFDPTIGGQFTAQDGSKSDTDDSVKIFRQQVRVKYKKF